MKNKESGIIKRRVRSSYFTSVISIALVLFLMGIAGLFVLNAKRVSDFVKENIGFSIILKDNIKEVEILRLQKLLDARPYVKSTEYITKEEAATELQKELGEDFIEILGYNPLLASIDVRFYADYANPDSISKIEKELQKYSEVKEVYYQKSLVHLVHENVRRISLVIVVFSGLLFFISAALINNTIRLSIYSKRFIINTMQLVGATRAFIRRPFVFKGAMQGIYAALVAVLMLIGVIYYIQTEIQGIVSLNDYKTLVALLGLELFLGVLICSWSTYRAVNKYLNIHIDKLYY